MQNLKVALLFFKRYLQPKADCAAQIRERDVAISASQAIEGTTIMAAAALGWIN
jgi:hypothetical protein